MFKKILFLTGALLVFTHTAMAYWEMEYDEYIRNIMAQYAGEYLPKRVGHFSNQDECTARLNRTIAESGPGLAGHVSCVGYDEVSSSSQQGSASAGANVDNNYYSQQQREARYRQRVKGFNKNVEDVEKETHNNNVEFNRNKENILSQLKGKESLGFKGAGMALALKSGNNTQAHSGGAAKAIKDLRNSVYWSLQAADSASSGSYNSAREYGENSAQGYEGGAIELPSVPDVPAPARANPQVQVYKLLMEETSHISNSLREINYKIKHAKKKKAELKEKIKVEEEKINKLEKAKNSNIDSKKEKNKPKGTGNNLLSDAMAILDKAKELDKKASEDINKFSSQKSKQIEELAGLKSDFEEVNKHPERAKDILKKIEGGKK